MRCARSIVIHVPDPGLTQSLYLTTSLAAYLIHADAGLAVGVRGAGVPLSRGARSSAALPAPDEGARRELRCAASGRK